MRQNESRKARFRTLPKPRGTKLRVFMSQRRHTHSGDFRNWNFSNVTFLLDDVGDWPSQACRDVAPPPNAQLGDSLRNKCFRG
jgi:hypothetical protein